MSIPMLRGARALDAVHGQRVVYPLWEKMVELDVPCTVHASGSQTRRCHTTNAYYIAHHNSAAVELLKSRVSKIFPN